jgi:polar amino acid transport system substrate-binding protein
VNIHLSNRWRALFLVTLTWSIMPWVFAKEVSGCTRPLWIAASPLGRTLVIGEDGQVTGTTRDVFARIAATTDCQFQYVVVPRARAFTMLKNGQVDIVTDATLTPDRLEGSNFTEIGKAAPSLISLARDLQLDTTTTDLAASNFSIITIHGHDYGEQYQAFIKAPAMQGRVSSASTADNAIKMLVAGRGHAILANPFVVVDAWQRIGQGVELYVSELQGMPSVPHGVYFSKQKMEPGDIAKIETALLSMLRSGELLQLSLRQYPDWIARKFQGTINKAPGSK